MRREKGKYLQKIIFSTLNIGLWAWPYLFPILKALLSSISSVEKMTENSNLYLRFPANIAWNLIIFFSPLILFFEVFSSEYCRDHLEITVKEGKILTFRRTFGHFSTRISRSKIKILKCKLDGVAKLCCCCCFI